MMFDKETIWSILSTHMRQEVKLYQNDRPQCLTEELVEHIVIELNNMADTKRRIADLMEEVTEAERVHQNAPTQAVQCISHPDALAGTYVSLALDGCQITLVDVDYSRVDGRVIVHNIRLLEKHVYHL